MFPGGWEGLLQAWNATADRAWLPLDALAGDRNEYDARQEVDSPGTRNVRKHQVDQVHTKIPQDFHPIVNHLWAHCYGYGNQKVQDPNPGLGWMTTSMGMWQILAHIRSPHVMQMDRLRSRRRSRGLLSLLQAKWKSWFWTHFIHMATHIIHTIFAVGTKWGHWDAHCWPKRRGIAWNRVEINPSEPLARTTDCKALQGAGKYAKILGQHKLWMFFCSPFSSGMAEALLVCVCVVKCYTFLNSHAMLCYVVKCIVVVCRSQRFCSSCLQQDCFSPVILRPHDRSISRHVSFKILAPSDSEGCPLW